MLDIYSRSSIQSGAEAMGIRMSRPQRQQELCGDCAAGEHTARVLSHLATRTPAANRTRGEVVRNQSCSKTALVRAVDTNHTRVHGQPYPLLRVADTGGATTTGPDATPPSYLSKLGGGSWGVVWRVWGGSARGGWGGGGGGAGGSGEGGSSREGRGGGSVVRGGGGIPQVGGPMRDPQQPHAYF